MTLALFALASLAVLRVHRQAQEKAGTRTCSSPRPHDRPDQQNAGRKRGPYQPPIDLSVALLPLTEIRQGLWALGPAASAEAATQVLAWSEWRRRHQARARRGHYQRHLARA